MRRFGFLGTTAALGSLAGLQAASAQGIATPPATSSPAGPSPAARRVASQIFKGSSGVVVGSVEVSAAAASAVEGVNRPDSPLPPPYCDDDF